MLDIINEEKIKEIIKKELEKYLLKKFDEEKKREEISFIGKDMELKLELEKFFIFKEDTEVLLVSDLNLKNIFNISNGIYENDFEEEIMTAILKNKEVIFIEEGLEYLKYDSIPKKLLDRYKSYLQNIKDYGVKIQSKEFFLKQKIYKEGIHKDKLLDLKKIKEFNSNGISVIDVLKNTIITSSALDYAKENNIKIVKRR